MEITIFPTKGNLIATRRSYTLANMGYDLMDKKRSILVRELMGLLDKAKNIQKSINENFSTAYVALQSANITLGVIREISLAMPEETGLSIRFRSVMGVEIPMVSLEEMKITVPYGLFSSNSLLDEAYISFVKVKYLCAVLAEMENSIYRLAYAIKKTQKRANALKNIIIPHYEDVLKYIADVLEERDREEFSRLKVIKKKKA